MRAPATAAAHEESRDFLLRSQASTKRLTFVMDAQVAL